MNIKGLEQQELLQAMNLVWDVFVEHTAPLYSKEGVESFQAFIKIDNITEKFYRGEIFLWGAYEGTELLGVSVLSKTGRICLLDVKTPYQAQGVERALFETMKQFCAQSLGIMRLNAHAAPNVVAIYQNLGFQATAPEQLGNGIRFVPMDYVISAASVQANTKKSRVGLVIGIIAGVLLLGSLGVFFVGRAVYRTMAEVSQSSFTYDDYYDDNDDGYDDENENGFEAIQEYIADDLEYEIEDIMYDEYEMLDNGAIMFYVSYPKLTDLDSAYAEEINQIFEDYAMNTANEYYINPSQETKKAVLQEGDLYLVEDVTYRVLYADNQVISVLFDKYTEAGELIETTFEMSGITINLNDGTVYDAKDLFTYDDDFMEEWLEIMEYEADGHLDVRSDLTLDEMRGILTDEEPIEGYQRVFFIRESGVEIGISYPNACVTAPYTWDELEGRITDSPLWDLLN